jgi:sugar O-acyltransferase (sialic acid O-acetyltransferase NeuD family)
MSRQLGIYGAGGFGREVAWLAGRPQESGSYSLAAYIDDAAAPAQTMGRMPVLPFAEFCRAFPDAVIALAVGNSATREMLAKKCEAAGRQCATLVASSAEMSESVRIGAGSIVCAGSILTVDIEIGRYVHINLDCTIGHDARLGDFTTLAPGVHVSGHVHIGRGVYIGTGANIINGTADRPLVIGDGAVIGAGACVTKSCESRCLYAGVPAELKKRY